MLPVVTPEHTRELEARDKRRAAAMQAHSQLAEWIDLQHPELRRPVGNLPRQWAALALKGTADLEKHFNELRDVAVSPARTPTDTNDRHCRVEAANYFWRKYQANLNAV